MYQVFNRQNYLLHPGDGEVVYGYCKTDNAFFSRYFAEKYIQKYLVGGGYGGYQSRWHFIIRKVDL